MFFWSRQQQNFALLLLCTSSWSTVVNGESLLGGRYETSNDVSSFLNLALDAADMKEASDLDTKRDIYENGIVRGDETAGTDLTLQGLSLNAKDTMKNSPMYLIFRHAFLVLGNANEGETVGKFDGNPIEQYGDTLVGDLFALDIADIETEAAVVVNVWMAAVNELFEAMNQCQLKDSDGALEHLDQMVALWIGAGQEEGSNEKGHLLYNLAENAGERFDQDDGETEINTRMIELFLALQSDFKAGTCSTEEGYIAVRINLKKLLGLATVPLVQNLIHHSMNLQNEDGSNYVELYALATIPRVAACDPQAYDQELHLDVLRTLKPSQAMDSIAAIQKAYSCLGITCADVGSYLGGALPECKDPTSVTLAGYSTSRADAIETSFLDRDIKQIDIFLKFGASEPAKDWYKFGWNSLYTLEELATNKAVPQSTNSILSTFQAYYSNDQFADNLFINMIEGNSPYNGATVDQLRNLAIGLLKYVVMFVSSMSALQYSLDRCDQNKDDALSVWDTGAIFYVGSMEGEDPNGSEFGGEFMFDTAQELCGDFNTCTSDETIAFQTAAINGIIVNALISGAEALSSGSCDTARDIVNNQILPAMPVPLYQGTLKYASYNAGLEAGTTDSALAIGSTFALGILPLLDQALPASAATVSTNMGFQLTAQPVSGGYSEVADAIRQALPSSDTKCDAIGVLLDEPNEADMCGGDASGGSTGSAVPAPTSSPQGASPTFAPQPQPQPTKPVEPADIAWGRYKFSSEDVADRDGNYALDIRDMFSASSIDEALGLYTNGKNAETTALSGEIELVSISSLSTEGNTYMSDLPLFNVYKYGLFDDDELDGEKEETFAYADEVVLEAFTNGQDQMLGAEGAVILNVFMLLVYRLSSAVDACKTKGSPDQFIDSAVALWIGKEQGEGKFDNGWMLYSVGQSTAKFFGFEEQEAKVNTELMDLFNEMQSIGQTCQSDTSAHISMRMKAFEITRLLTKTFILSLLFHLIKDSKNMVELYAVAAVPQAYACEESAAGTLEATLYSGYSYPSSLKAKFKTDLATFLRCQRITCADLEFGPNVDANLEKLVGHMCQHLDHYKENNDFLPMAGYVPATDVTEEARLDLDCQEIEIMLSTQSYKAAADIYTYGHNSFSDQTKSKLVSLQSLATSPDRESVLQYQLLSEYFSSPTYADDIMMDVLNKEGSFASATASQLEEAAFRTLQTMITFMETATRMKLAIDKCNSNNVEAAAKDWDVAAALYMGSKEGLSAPGLTEGDGEFMHALGNEICSEFDTCEASGQAAVNQFVTFEFGAGRDSIQNGECDNADRTATFAILPRMTLPIIQGLLAYANDFTSSTDDSEVSTVHILALSIIPLVKKVSASSAASLEQAFGDFGSIPTGATADSIADALVDAIRGMGIECEELGKPDWSSSSLFCKDVDEDGNVVVSPGENSTAPLPDTPTNLGDDLYITTTYVQDKANIALDVRDINDAIREGNIELAQLLYRGGKNSEVYDENGKFVSTRSLESFSSVETLDMLDESLFNIYMYALKDGDKSVFMSNDIRLYANSFVEDAFKSSDATIAAEATVALNVWMQTVHSLYETLKNCKKKQLRDEDGVHSIDVAAAYWIGDDQVAGDGERGHLLYALAERMGEKFNLDTGGQTRTNSNVLKLLNEAKSEIMLPGACGESPASFMRLQRIVNRIISAMSVPNIQGLIDSLRSNDRARVRLYALAFVPMTAGCNPSVFSFLKEKLIQDTWEITERETIVDSIRSTYSCFGLQCADIGVHGTEMTSENAECQDPPVFNELAGYKPASDVREYARLDLDLRELDLLMEMKAYSAAEDLYLYGKHVSGANGGSLSLSQIATSTDRSIVPEFDSFLRYYDTDTYADDIVRSTFSESENWTEAQRRVVAVRTSQVMIMFFGVLEAFYQSVSDCEEAATLRSGGSSDSWDKGAAMLIGYLEGSEKYGTMEGYMYYDLAQEYCEAFDTCQSANTGVKVNDELITLLYTGRGAVLSSSCSALRKAADEISEIMLVPVIQGALSASINLSSDPSEPISRAEGYVYSRAILPLADNADRDAGSDLDKNLGVPGPSPTKDTAKEVFQAFKNIYPKMSVDCVLIGEVAGNNACSGVKYKSNLEKNQIWMIVGIVLGVLFLVGCCILYRSRRRNAKLPENNPRFVAPEQGELNHSMDLLEKAFSTKDIPRTPQSAETVGLTEDLASEDVINNASQTDDDDFEEMTALKSDMDSTPDII